MRTTYLRTKETMSLYRLHTTDDDGCFICEDDRQKYVFKHWFITPNDFPYDAIASQHDMLCTKRHVASFYDLTLEEHNELQDILNMVDYDGVMYNFKKNQTHESHLHLHLLNMKTE